MPITAFWCSTCMEPADREHYQPWAPCTSGITTGHIDNVLTHAEGRPKTGWSVTQLSGCLRATVIERTEDCTVDPASYSLMELGTAWDAWITRKERPKIRWHGSFGGLEISGEPDGYNLCGPVIWDYKKL